MSEDFDTIVVDVTRHSLVTIAVKVPKGFELSSKPWHPQARLIKPFFESLDFKNLLWEILPGRVVRPSSNEASATLDARPYLSGETKGGAQ
jgi:hypothetical protein